MAEAVRNAVLAMVVVTSAHIALLIAYKPGRADARGDATSVSGPSETGPGSPRGREAFFADQSSATNNMCTPPPTVSTSNLPMDGLHEMFEFASARGTWGVPCDHPDLGAGAQGAGMLKRTDEVFPEQVAGPHAVVNSYEGEGIANGGGGAEDVVAAFDGWGDVATFDPCQ